MSAARRDWFVSSAQVAYHFGGYTLESALSLCKEDRELLLAVVRAEEERAFDRFEQAMGIQWNVEDLVNISLQAAHTKRGGKPTEPLTAKVRIPALLALAPEMFKAMTDGYRKRYMKSREVMKEAPAGNTVVGIETLSPDQAKELFKHILGQAPAIGAPPKAGT